MGAPSSTDARMNDRYYHTPASTRIRCPVCHEPVYSQAGIHPQCAARRAERPGPKGGVKGPPGEIEWGRQAGHQNHAGPSPSHEGGDGLGPGN